MRAEFPVNSTNETLRSAPLVSLPGRATLEEVRMSDGACSEDGSRPRLVLFARWGIAVTTSSTLPVDSPAALEAMQVKLPESFRDVTLMSRLPLGKTNVLKRIEIVNSTVRRSMAAGINSKPVLEQRMASDGERLWHMQRLGHGWPRHAAASSSRENHSRSMMLHRERGNWKTEGEER
ncbi:hypothetical protein EYF80_055606 [Liparis tanakae]|uniref:Uncharacterized protein n=1 Tax=Liparis tanakae TaxID=230148 RepID=A0A4Z2EZV9_9TELE|nr:hypothetical protein EYF80_055606 [Liparis tanakae]